MAATHCGVQSNALPLCLIVIERGIALGHEHLVYLCLEILLLRVCFDKLLFHECHLLHQSLLALGELLYLSLGALALPLKLIEFLLSPLGLEQNSL